MIRAQWGLKDKLVGDPDIWLCHQCNDCSAHCPRGAKPGDVMAAIRQASIRHFAFPGFLGKWMSHPKYLPLLLGLPVVLLGLAVIFFRSQATATSGKIIYPILLPQWVLICIFTVLGVVAVGSIAAGTVRLWRAMKAGDEKNGTNEPVNGLPASFGATLKGILRHEKFNMCDTERIRAVSHLVVLYGFVALFAAGLWAMTAKINPLLGEGFVYPFSFWNPWRMLGNLGGLAVVGGCLLMIYERIKEREQAVATSYFDWFFVVTLLLVAVSGLAAEGLHYARMEPHRYLVYFSHLVLAFMLLLYLPYSKFAHIVYRTTAMVYAEYSGRSLGDPKVLEPATGREVKAEEAEQVKNGDE